jgi:hypothetical protein
MNEMKFVAKRDFWAGGMRRLEKEGKKGRGWK